MKKYKLVATILLTAHFVAAICLLIVVALHFAFDIPAGELTRDTVQVLKGNIYHGFLSQVGMTLWSGTAGVCLFMVLLNLNEKEKKAELHFFILALVLTVLLLLDDMFMIHDIALRAYLDLSEIYLYLVYGILTLVFLIHCRKLILATPYFILFVGLFLFGSSIFIDIIAKFVPVPAHYFVEDAAKFLGITNWGVYFLSVGNLSAKGRLTT